MEAAENYLEKCVHSKVDIEALERLMEPASEEVSPRYILKYAGREEAVIFSSFFDTAEKMGHFVASSKRWRVRERRQQSRKVGNMSGMT